MARKPTTRTAIRTHHDEHPGVSYLDQGGGRWRLRWRETTSDGSTVGQSWTFRGSPSEVREAAIAVHRAVETRGTFDRNAYRPTAVAPENVPFRRLAAAFIKWKRDDRKAAPRTIQAIKLSLRHAETELAILLRCEPVAVPCAALTLGNLARVREALRRGGLGGSALQQSMQHALALWRFGAADARSYPGLDVPPMDSALVVPVYKRKQKPEDPPTWNEVDAVIRRAMTAPGTQAGYVLAVASRTGLRIGAVGVLTVGSFYALDTDNPRVVLPAWKGKPEADVPLARSIVPLVREVIGDRPGDARLFPSTRIGHAARTALQAATEAGEIRRSCWQSDARGNDRITHWARAAFQFGLLQEGVSDRVVDRLVQHAGRSVRDRHYVTATEEQLRAAVELIPAVDLTGPVEADNVVRLPGGYISSH